MERRTSQLTIRLFGSFYAEKDGQPLPGLHLREGKRLLAYLVLHHGQDVSYRSLAERFWPAEARSVVDGGGDLSSTRQALRGLRTALGEDAERLENVGRGLVRFDLRGIDIDLFQFDRLTSSDNPADWQRAVGLYTAPLLEEWSDSWIAAPRNRRQREYDRLTRQLAQTGASADTRSLAVLHNLPQQLSSFIGRESEIALVRSFLATTRLLTLTGVGGGGKTRMALQVATQVLPNYPDGVWFVELAPVARHSVTQAVAQTLGIAERIGRPILPTVVDALKSRRLLLILDNCEHLLPECSEICMALRRSCPQVTILATSREAMHVEGERAYIVPALTTPDPWFSGTAEALMQFESVRLFHERAVFHKHSFTLTDQNARAVATLCSRLDGMPLAIELAAARVRSLSVEEINARLDDRFRLLTGGDPTRPARQQTLRALIDWSYNLLTEQEIRMFRRLSVFAGGWTLEAAEAIVSGNGFTVGDALDLIESLVDKSLVLANDGTGSTRYRMLETLRQYAAEKLAESGEMSFCQSRHCDFFLSLAQRSEIESSGRDHNAWKQRLEDERDNFHAALEYCRTRRDREEAEQILVRMLTGLWERTYWREGRTRLERLLTSGDLAIPHDREKALQATEWLRNVQKERRAYQELYSGSELPASPILSENHREPTRAKYEQLGDWLWQKLEKFGERVRGLGQQVILNRGESAWEAGDFAAARRWFEESLAMQRETGNPGIEGAILLWLSWYLAYQEGDMTAARLLCEQALSLNETLDQEQQSVSLHTLGRIAVHQRDFPMARYLVNESLRLNLELGDQQMEADNLILLGQMALEEDDLVAARSLFGNSLRLRLETNRAKEGISGVAYMATVLALEGRSEQAARLLGAYSTVQEKESLSAMPGSHQISPEAWIARLSELLGKEAFTTAWEIGQTFTTEEAIAVALADEHLELP